MSGAACGCRGDGPRYEAISALPDWATAAVGVLPPRGQYASGSTPRALAILQEWVKTTGAEMNEARLRMTRIPKGAELILNKVSGAPGF